MNKTNLIVIFFIFLISFNKINNDINIDFENNITNILNEINKTDDKYIFVLIENIWSILPYQINI